ncbi:hypothetical protein [Nostoc sp.]
MQSAKVRSQFTTKISLVLGWVERSETQNIYLKKLSIILKKIIKQVNVR